MGDFWEPINIYILTQMFINVYFSFTVLDLNFKVLIFKNFTLEFSSEIVGGGENGSRWKWVAVTAIKPTPGTAMAITNPHPRDAASGGWTGLRAAGPRPVHFRDGVRWRQLTLSSTVAVV